MKANFSIARVRSAFINVNRRTLALVLAALVALSSFTMLSNFLDVHAEPLENFKPTEHTTITDYQKARWGSIQNAIFGTDEGKVTQPNDIKGKAVNEGNPYFNWVPNGQILTDDGTEAPAWDGGDTPVTKITKETIYYEGDRDGTQGEYITYVRYDVSTPSEFHSVMNWLRDRKNNKNQYISIHIMNDLNMNGAKQTWTPVDMCNDINENYNSENYYMADEGFKRYVYIEGHGHTIYNLKIYGYGEKDSNGNSSKSTKGAGLFSCPPPFLTVKNLGFKSQMVLDYDKFLNYSIGGLITAQLPKKMYLYNVHASNGYYQVYDEIEGGSGSGLGGLVGRSNISPYTWRGSVMKSRDIGDTFYENCSTSNLLMYGGDHVGGMTSWQGMQVSPVYGYNKEFPTNPERYVMHEMSLPHNQASKTHSTDEEKAKENLIKWTADLDYVRSNTFYPNMFLNCSSTDCEIFSVGHDSGALISCGRGIVAKDCYSNNHIYSNDNTGGFIGRACNEPLGVEGLKDDNGNQTIGSYFENCYASGIVEGKEAMGGFIGLDSSARARGTIYYSAGDARGDIPTYSNIFYNCYSTAMVGMDYAGKYCGGFVGMNDSYNKRTPTFTVGTDKYGGNGERGSFYINCYAAGEVGNVMTVTDFDDALKKEQDYLNGYENKKQDDGTVYDYYPTGGFAGANGYDEIYTKKGEIYPGSGYNRNVDFDYGTSSYYNCYYDMQTTAMHEMAVGMSKSKTARDKTANNNLFQLTGVTGLYTQKSDVKEVPGLTDDPKSYVSKNNPNGKSFSMDDDGLDSDTWSYKSEYYPQISEFMVTDFAVDDIFEVGSQTASFTAAQDSGFFTKTTDGGANASYPVLSRVDPDGQTARCTKDLTKANQAASVAGVLRAYRYSQASTATVLLNHWDNTMDVNSGITGQENNWVTGLPINKMTKVTLDDGTTEFQKEYKNLTSGTYQFKVQAENSWSFNYGATRGGSNCEFKVNDDGSDVLIHFSTANAQSDDFYIKVEVTSPSGTTTTAFSTEGVKHPSYTVAGSIDKDWEWNAYATNEKGEPNPNVMTYMGDGKTYKLVYHDVEPGDYAFKVTKGLGWAESYGKNGGEDVNNTFTLTDTASTLTITFDSTTRLCSVDASPRSALTAVDTGEGKIDFTGYSVVFDDRIFTGHEWFDKYENGILQSCIDGALTYNPDSKLYEKTIRVTANKDKQNQNYGFKVVKDGIDEGDNSYFYINGTYLEDLDDPSFDLTVTYNPVTKEQKVKSNPVDIVRPPAPDKSYSVVGVKELTGFNWLNDNLGLDAAKAGKMDEPLAGSGSKIYSKTYENIKKGNYSFKVAANAIENGGKWGKSYGGNGASGNYVFELTDACDVTIYFDSSTGKISVSADHLKEEQWVLTGPEILMGENHNWDLTTNLMTYDAAQSKYVYKLKGVKANTASIAPDGTTIPNINYCCKVVPYGEDKGENIPFILRPCSEDFTENSTYDLTFIYDNVYNKLDIKVEYQGVNVTDEALDFNVEPRYYSVIGDSALTGINWVDNKPEAALQGKMEISEESDDILCKEYDIEVPKYSPSFYGFKVAANGSYDSGLSWGNGEGGDLIFAVRSDEIRQTKVKIFFNTITKEVWYELADPAADSGFSSDKLNWYIAGESALRSNNGYKSQAHVYDTVRDITSTFNFTCGEGNEQKGLAWSKDETLINESGFKDKVKFDLDYTQAAKSSNIHSTFEGEVVELTAKAVGSISDINNSVARFTCTSFMPGKNWTKVSAAGYGLSTGFTTWKNNYLKYAEYQDRLDYYETAQQKYLLALSGVKYRLKTDGENDPVRTVIDAESLLEYLRAYPETDAKTAKKVRLKDGETLLGLYNSLDAQPKPDAAPTLTQTIVGSRDIRLIPTAYLEAGNDAMVEIVQSKNDKKGDSAINNVTYAEKDDRVTTTIDSQGNAGNVFNYYNYAVTAGYIITDKIGLGDYDNYMEQNVIEYRSDKVRDDNNNAFRNSTNDNTGGKHRHFAMSSAYNTTDNLAASTYTDNGARSRANLHVGEFVDESTQGSSFNRTKTSFETGASEELKAKTIVKIFKLNENGERVLVNTDPSAGISSDYGANYAKWNGQENFNADDEGDYDVVFYWALSDGRYLSSYKRVTMVRFEPKISISVDPQYQGDHHFEKIEGTDDYKITKPDEVTYTVHYENTKTNSNIDFAVLNVLPFDGSKRFYEDKDGVMKSLETKFANNAQPKFKLKSVQLKKSSEQTIIKGFYYTTSKNVQTICNPEGGADDPLNEKAATHLGLSDPKDDNLAGLISSTQRGDNGCQFRDFTKNDGEYYKEGVFDITPDMYGYDDGGIDGVTAIAISGIMLGIDDSIDIICTYEFDGECKDIKEAMSDLQVNSAHFHAKSKDTSEEISERSNVVTSSMLTRSMSGYVWYDSNANGVYDKDEKPLEGVNVKLMYRYTEGQTEKLGEVKIDNPKAPGGASDYIVQTDENGLYTFENIPQLPSGNLEIHFLESDYVRMDGEVIDYNSLRATKAWDYYDPARKEPERVVRRDDDGNISIETSDPIGSESLAYEVKNRGTALSKFKIEGKIVPTDNDVVTRSYMSNAAINCYQAENSMKYGKYYQNLGLVGNATSTVSGYVWADSTKKDGLYEKDNIFKKGDSVLSGVTVNLFADNSPNTPIATTTTNSDGYYEFKGVNSELSRSYHVEFSIDGMESFTAADGVTYPASMLKFGSSVDEKEWNNSLNGAGGLANSGKTASFKLPSDSEALKKDPVYPDDITMNRSYSGSTFEKVFNLTMRNCTLNFDPSYSFSLNKQNANEGSKDETDKTVPAVGAKFIAEYSTDGGSSWSLLMYKKQEAEGKTEYVQYTENKYTYSQAQSKAEELAEQGVVYEFETNANGDITVNGSTVLNTAFEGQYRVTELESSENGVGKLTAPVYFSLPYKLGENEQNGDMISDKDNVLGTVYDDKNKPTKSLYTHVSLKLTDPPSQFILPRTGKVGLIIVVAGALLLSISVILVVSSRKKKHRR